MDDAPLTRLHWKVWFLSAMGIFLDGFDLFIIGVAMPLINENWKPEPWQTGAIGVAAVLGAALGAVTAGWLTDKFGRKKFYVADLAFCMLAAALTALSWDIYSLIAFRFILGVGIGADYPICASFISEFMPARIRGRMIISGFCFQALGMLSAALAGLLILTLMPTSGEAWRLMLMIVVVPAAVVLIFRLGVPESPRWLISHRDDTHRAAGIIHMLVPAKKHEIEKILSSEKKEIQKSSGKELGYRELFTAKYLPRTVLAAVPWFLMDIATYGIGVFTPMIFKDTVESGNLSVMDAAFRAAKEAAVVDAFLIAGFMLNLIFVERIGRIKLQTLGFAGMTAGLLVLSAALSLPGGGAGNLHLVLAGFVIFNLTMNAGPNATTFMLPVELFPTKIRGSGHGFAAAAAKAGAAFGVFFLPVMQAFCGVGNVMIIIAGVCVLAGVVTWIFKVETRGRSLDELEPWEAGAAFDEFEKSPARRAQSA
jgi:MFS family permease